MITAFWSNVHGQPGTTSNMIAIAAAAALGCGKRCIMTQTHFKLNGLESYLTGNRENGKDMLMDIGLDGLTSVIKLRAIDQATIENYSVPLMKGRLTLLPGTTGGNRQLFEDEMGKTISLLLNEMNRYYDLVFVDVNSGADKVSKLILDKADIIAVNLCQNRSVISSCMAGRQPKGKKLLYLIGGYDKASSYNLNNLKLLYKAFTHENTGIIPYNTGFMDAQSNGMVLSYINKNFNAGKDNHNGYFMASVKEAANRLVRLAEGGKDGIAL